MRLVRSGRPIETVFDLLGTKEDDMTYSLGFVLSRVPAFASALSSAVGARGDASLGGEVRLQSIDGDGRTDVEFVRPGRSHIIFEAKRGSDLPGRTQLQKYTRRFRDSDIGFRKLVAVTNATPEYAGAALPGILDGVEVVHLSWREIRDLARKARRRVGLKERYLLAEFEDYLTEVLGMENAQSNIVWIVPLSDASAWGVGFKDVVNRQRRYFYPITRRAPPNYVGFYCDKLLQSIHHVESYSIFSNPRSVFPSATSTASDPCYLLELGPPIRPMTKVGTGPSLRRGSLDCMLDLLLTSATVTEAWKETKRRLGRG